MAATVALLSDIEALSFDDIAGYFDHSDEEISQEDGTVYVTVDLVDIPDEKLSLYPEEDTSDE